jgi:hypothetical protein
MLSKIYLFYESSVTDRWFIGDHLIRKYIKKVLGFKPHFSSGVDNWFLNLCLGLKKNNIDYRVNDFKGLQKERFPLAFVIAPSSLLDKIPKSIPIIYGPAISSHPSNIDWNKYFIKHIVSPCDWLAKMYARDLKFDIPISVFPIGIRTDIWKPKIDSDNKYVIVYDKVRWERDYYSAKLINPIIAKLNNQFGKNVKIVKYGNYKEHDFKNLVVNAKFMVFLCEHETQGFAYQQVLACNVPIIAWDREDDWKDPDYYPNKVIYGPVQSVPFWSGECGEKFRNFNEFIDKFDNFYNNVSISKYAPRNFILKNLSLEGCAKKYIELSNIYYENLRN